MALVACGGNTNPISPPPPPGPPPPPPTGLTTVSGTLTVPSGSSFSPTALTVAGMGRSTAPTSAGSFSLGVSPIAPTLAIARDANGNGIMAGFLDPATGAAAITPRSTGVALAWFAMGGPFLPAPAKSQALALLTADSRLDALGTVIGQRIAANPKAVVDGDAQIASALGALLDALVPPAAITAPEAQLGDNAPQIIIAPITEQGGVALRTDGVVTGIDLSNSFRRPVKVYVYEVRKSTNGVATDIVPAKLVAGPLSMDEPLNLTPVGGISALLNGAKPFDAFTIGPIELALDGTSDETTFEVVVIGPSANGVTPAFFGAARYASQVADWNAAVGDMFLRTYFIDTVYAYVLELSGFASLLPTLPSLVPAASNLRNALGNPFPPLPSGPPLPSNGVGLRNNLKNIEQQMQFITDGYDEFKNVGPLSLDSVGAAAMNQINKVDWQASLRTGSNFVAKLASPFSGAKANGALSRLFSNLADADRGVMWTVTLSKAKATINPPSPLVDAGGIVALTLALSSDLTSTYDYEWSQNGTGSELSASDAPAAGSITTKQKSVNLSAMPDQTGEIVVQVAVYDIATPGRRVLVTRASTKVRILQRSTISPSPKALFRGNQQVFTVAAVGTLPAGAKYVWNVVGQAGTIGSVGQVTTTVPSINYTAVNKGDDQLKVQITDASGLLLSRSTAVINVDPSSFFECTIAGFWDRERTPANGRYFYGDMTAQRSLAPESGLDWLTIICNIAPDDTIGVFLGIFVPTNHVFAAGQTFTRIQTPNAPTARSFNMFLSVDQNDVENSNQRTPEGTGTLTLTSINNRSDGKKEGLFSFTLSNGSGTIIGTTSAAW